MRRLAIFVVRRRWWVIAVALVALPLSALYGGGVHDKLSPGGFVDPGVRVGPNGRGAIAKEFPSSAQSDFVIARHREARNRRQSRRDARPGSRSPSACAAATGVVTAFVVLEPRQPRRLSPLSSRDQRQALVFASLRGDGRREDQAGRQAGARVRRRHQGHHAPA